MPAEKNNGLMNIIKVKVFLKKTYKNVYTQDIGLRYDVTFELKTKILTII